jgi:hypothetical protein
MADTPSGHLQSYFYSDSEADGIWKIQVCLSYLNLTTYNLKLYQFLTVSLTYV